MTDVKTEMAKVVRQYTKPDPRYLKTRATQEVASDGVTAFVLLEQIDLVAVGNGGDVQYRWSVWLMKSGDKEFSRVHEEHAYESERELYLRLIEEGGKFKAHNEEGKEVWSYDPKGECV